MTGMSEGTKRGHPTDISGAPISGAFVPERRLLLAVEEAADDDGWATASEVAYQYDGREVATGQWAKKLWAHESKGLLECRPMPASRFSWALTEAGMELLYAD